MIHTWGVRQLVASWVLYWIALAVIVAAPTLWKIWSLRRADATGEVRWNFEGGLPLALVWIFGPPLLVTIVWLVTRPRR